MAVHEHSDRPEEMKLDICLEQYFVDISVGCPYGLEQLAVYHQAMFTSMGDDTMGRFFANGYRRNGNCIYSMHCPCCKACVPIRLRPERFDPNRNQKRVLQKNRDVTAGVAPLQMSRENLALLDRYLQTRFPESRSTAEEYYAGFFISAISRCFEIRYRVRERLIGVAIVDGSDMWLNAVYFYFDPAEGKRSPGTYNILNLISFCTRNNIPLLYLGYYIEKVKAMRYKRVYNPHELLIKGKWREINRGL
ncbi:MAG: arginyltransferase [Desulfobulbaceae bacterium]|nr:arginyltransferase [Desulfobulbaceae bacterium]